jgi:hypothetical protein
MFPFTFVFQVYLLLSVLEFISLFSKKIFNIICFIHQVQSWIICKILVKFSVLYRHIRRRDGDTPA